MKVMYRLCRLFPSVAGFAAALAIGSVPAAAGPTVVELFTSQGCSACPPADTTLETLRDQPDILALSWPIDYWDRLGWRDTFAMPNNAVRQTAYNKRLGRGGVYTPQMVFDGITECVGSDRTKIRDHIDELRAKSQTAIPVALGLEGTSLVVGLPETALDEDVAVRIVWYLGDASVVVGDGENAGRTLHYTNVVRASDVLQDWNGKAASLTLDLAPAGENGADHAAILLQKGYGHGPIVGAASIDLRNILSQHP